VTTTPDNRDDTSAALRFMLVKAAIFVGVPVVASLVAVLMLLA
jgi:hypothetical protein